MAHFNLPSDLDPLTRAWLLLPRRVRRQAWRDARAGLRADQPGLTKSQRRRATPWQPILVNPDQAHLLSGHANRAVLPLIRAGLNRAARRRLKARSRGPSERRR